MNIQRQLREDGTCLLTFAREDEGENRLDVATLEELNAHLAAIAEPTWGAKGLVLLSARPGQFLRGWNADELRATDAAAFAAWVELGQRASSLLAALTIPTVAAIDGACVGGGLELALACDWRVVTSDSALALPDVALGLLPSFGGSWRLPRRVGLEAALAIVLEGQPLGAELADDVALRAHLLPVALEWLGKGKRPSKLARPTWIEKLSAPHTLSQARARVQERTRGLEPAPRRALELPAALRADDESAALALERETARELWAAPATPALIALAAEKERARQLEVPGAPEAPPIRHVALLGAGRIGSALAHLFSTHRHRVLLRDLAVAPLARSLAEIDRLLANDLQAGEARDRLSPAHTEVPLRRADLVLDCTPEDLVGKRTALAQAVPLLRADALLATTTAALPLRELQQPSRLLGLHFFPPVTEHELVEIIAQPETSPAALQRALRFAQDLGKIPVLVKDSPGFLVNRILLPSLVEATELFWSGLSATAIDEAMLEFGLRRGPLQSIDEHGLAAMDDVARYLAQAFPQWMRLPRVLPKMREAGVAGFYVKATKANPAAEKLRPRGKLKMTPEEIQQRLVLLLVNEATRCLEERLAEGPAEIDLALVLGAGFPAFRGGPLRYADEIGAAKIVEQLSAFADSAGSHYTPAPLLVVAAKNGISLSGRNTPAHSPRAT